MQLDTVPSVLEVPAFYLVILKMLVFIYSMVTEVCLNLRNNFKVGSSFLLQKRYCKTVGN